MKNLPIIWVIAKNTWRETIRDRILYSLIGFSILVIVATLLAASVSLGQDTRVIESFGLTAMLVFLFIITIFIGTQLVYREVERKTIYLVLSKPVSRTQFYLGKFIGLCLTIAVAAIIMGLVFLVLLKLKAHVLPLAAVVTILLMILEAWLLTAVGMLFSSFTSPIASAVYTFSLALIGHASTTIWLIAHKSTNILVRYALEAVYYLFPNLEKFNLRNEVVYNLIPNQTQIWTTLLYFIGYLLFLLLLGVAVFEQDEF